jgi:flagellar M-ring protein FliF
MIEQITQFYQSLESRERFTFVAALSLTMIAMVAVLFWVNSEGYKPIYTSNDSSQVQSAKMALESAGIPYKVSEDGFQLEVPIEHVGQARITTASVSTISGMEVLNSMKLGASPQQERWIYLNALQGELTKTINSLDEVSASRVHIVESETSDFLKRDEQSSASVTVKLHPGQQLNNAQIQGITSLVAGAVKNLKANQVVLVDESGALLTGNTEEDKALMGATTLLQSRMQHEQRFKRSILEHLTPIVGSSTDVSVAVTVDVADSAVETNKMTYDPNSQVTVSESIKESSSKEDTPVGIPGSQSNLPSQVPSSDESSDEKFQSATNYEYSSTAERTVRTLGAPERVSASVMVNALALQSLVDASGGTIDLTTLKSEIEAAVKSTVGFSALRGDVVSVSYVPFAPLSTATDLVVSTGWDLEVYIKYAMMLLVVLLLFFGVIRPIMTTYTTTVLMEDDVDLTSAEKQALEESENSSLALARKLRKMVDNFETVNSEDLSRLVEMHEQPSAEVLRRWLRVSN